MSFATPSAPTTEPVSAPILPLADGTSYRWHEAWAEIDVEQGWSHHGLVCTADDRVITSRADAREARIYASDGRLLTSFALDVVDAHGLSLTSADAGDPSSASPHQGSAPQQTLWVTDAGKRRRVGGDYAYPEVVDGCLVRYDLSGTELQRIDRSAFPHLGPEQRFSPTVCVADDERNELWVTDGYGSQTVMALTADGEVRVVIDGTSGAGRFDCPHWIHLDRRGSEPQLLVADRFSHRIQAFDLDGGYVRTFGEGVTRTPSVFATWHDWLIVGELQARVSIFDRDDRLVGTLGDGASYLEQPGWPNRFTSAGLPQRPADLVPGRFNSPHGLGVDQAGHIYVAEWLIGGRLTKLERIDD